MIYDITRELFSAEVYPGDPSASKEYVMSFEGEEPDVCQLTELVMGSHTGTHMDAPRHFLEKGKDVAEIDLSKCTGTCKVVQAAEHVTKEEMEQYLSGGVTRLLLKGAADISAEAAECLVEKDVVCIGVESLSVGPFSAPMKVHKILLGAEIVILECLDLKEVPEGEYELMALPLKMEGLDGSPIRAILRTKE